ncbi:MAG: hypothetical protein ACRYGG_11835 [Janthinobacterium lividum]
MEVDEPYSQAFLAWWNDPNRKKFFWQSKDEAWDEWKFDLTNTDNI